MDAFLVRMPSGVRYWTVVDDELRPAPAADAYLRHVRFGRDGAESTTKSYAGAVALYLTWCVLTGRDWTTAAGHLGAFVLWLRHAAPGGAGAPSVVPGPGAEPVRGPRRINAVLAAVRVLVLRGGSGRCSGGGAAAAVRTGRQPRPSGAGPR